jgi:hypothetical protein
MALFYALSFLSGFFETGSLMMGLSPLFTRVTTPEAAQVLTSAIIRALACALCYQIGNLVPRPLELPKSMVITSGILGAFCFTCVLLPLPPVTVLAASLLGTLSVSACIQSARSVMKSGAPKMLKRGARIAGFALGFFCTPNLIAAAAVLTVLFTVVVLRRVPAIKARLILPRVNGLNIVMVFHQMHYFVYCYAVLIAAFERGGKTAAILAFLLSWIVYLLSPLLYRKVKDLRKVFFLGHSLLVLILTGLYLAPSLPLKIVLYLLTGIGGTTEFCIGGLGKKWGIYNEDAQNFSENLGHVLGVTSCLILFIICGDLKISSLFAAVFALAAIVCMAKMVVAVNKEDL